MQLLLDLPIGTIDFSAVHDKGQTGYSVAHEKGHTAILELLANAGHGDKQEVAFLIACKEGKEDDLRETLREREPIVKSCGAKEFREACKTGNEVTVKWFLQECKGLVDFNKCRRGVGDADGAEDAAVVRRCCAARRGGRVVAVLIR